MEDADVTRWRSFYLGKLEKHARYTIEFLRKHYDRPVDIDRVRANILQNIRDCLLTGTASKEAIDSIMLMRDYMWQRGLWREWNEYVVLGIEKAQHVGRIDIVGQLITYRAGLHEALADWQATIKLTQDALGLEIDSETRSEALYHYGTAMHYLGRYSGAQSAFQTALALTTDRARTMRIKHKLSRSVKALGDEQAALAMLDQVLIWTREEQFEWFEAEVLLDKAGILKRTSIESALALVHQSLEIYTSLGFIRGIAYTYLELGRIYSEGGRTEEALKALGDSKVLFEKMNYSPGLAHIALALGSLHLGGRHYEAAAALFSESFRHAHAVNYTAGMLRATAHLFLAHRKNHRYTECLKVLPELLKLLYRVEVPLTLKLWRFAALWGT